jgi:hypothetical protein
MVSQQWPERSHIAFPLIITVPTFTEFVVHVSPPGPVHLCLVNDNLHLQGMTSEQSIVWLSENRSEWPSHRYKLDRLYDLVKEELTARGYSVKRSTYVLPEGLHPMDGKFNCVAYDSESDVPMFSRFHSMVYEQHSEWKKQFEADWTAFCDRHRLSIRIRNALMGYLARWRIDFRPSLAEFLAVRSDWEHISGLGPKRTAELQAAIEAEGITIQEEFDE